jgi:hypothetical protein
MLDLICTRIEQKFIDISGSPEYTLLQWCVIYAILSIILVQPMRLLDLATKGLYRGSAKGRRGGGGGGGKYIGYKIIVATKPAQRGLKILGLKSFSFRSKSFIEKEKKKKKIQLNKGLTKIVSQ